MRRRYSPQSCWQLQREPAAREPERSLYMALHSAPPPAALSLLLFNASLPNTRSHLRVQLRHDSRRARRRGGCRRAQQLLEQAFGGSPARSSCPACVSGQGRQGER